MNIHWEPTVTNLSIACHNTGYFNNRRLPEHSLSWQVWCCSLTNANYFSVISQTSQPGCETGGTRGPRRHRPRVPVSTAASSPPTAFCSDPHPLWTTPVGTYTHILFIQDPRNTQTPTPVRAEAAHQEFWQFLLIMTFAVLRLSKHITRSSLSYTVGTWTTVCERGFRWPEHTPTHTLTEALQRASTEGKHYYI